MESQDMSQAAEFEAARSDAGRVVARINELVGRDVAQVSSADGREGAEVSITIDDDVMTQNGAQDATDLLRILESQNQ